MGHTNRTANYQLPQFIGTDKPSWLGDINDAFQKMETALNTLANVNSVQESTIAALTARVAALEAK